jgi:hypothetical protein
MKRSHRALEWHFLVWQGGFILKVFIGIFKCNNIIEGFL